MDHGFLYGMGLFETLRTYGGKPFLLERHLARLTAGCKTLGIDVSALPDDLQVREWIAELMQANGWRKLMSATRSARGRMRSDCPRECIAVPLRC
ncbi:4-amino-4-deoxychorismate lyase [Paenibacillus sp. P1XP2]|nr:4-amino-4-deoxychorismate lyase [Paenibacillus sp. P1XP2]